MSRLLGWLALALLVVWIGTNPGPAADVLRGVGAGAATVVARLTGSAG